MVIVFMGKIKENIGILFLYFACTCVLTYPLIKYFTTYLGGDGGDGWQCLWNYWWINKAVIELKQNFYHTDFLFYPYGHTLVFHGLNVFNGFLSIPLQSFLDLITTYNCILFSTFVVSGFNMYLLLRYLTGNRIASFVGGFVFTFSPYHMGHALGHMHLMTMEWMPLYVLYFLKTQEYGGVKNTLLAALFLVLVELSTEYYLLFSLMFSFVYIFFFGIKKKALLSTIRKFVPIPLLTFMVLSPLFIIMIRESWGCRFLGAHDPEVFSADLMSFFIPGEIQTIGHIFKPLSSITSKFTGNPSENGNYLGYTVLFLVFFSVCRLWRKQDLVPFLTLVSFAFIVLSLGTHLHVFGQIINIPLPYYAIYKFIPLVSFSGVPERFLVMTFFCFSALAAFAVKEILDSAGGTRKALILTCLIILLFGEYGAIPFTLSNSPGTSFKVFKPSLMKAKPFDTVPKFYKTISRDKDDYGIFDVDVGGMYSDRATKVLYYQTVHNKKILFGFIARIKTELRDLTIAIPGVPNIALNTNITDVSADEVRVAFRKNRIKYVIVPAPSYRYLPNYIVESYGFPKVYADNQIFVYQTY